MGFVSTDNLKSLLYICALCIILVFSFVWRQRVLDVFAYEYDEGIHLVLAQVLSAGYEPYREVFVSYPPLFASYYGCRSIAHGIVLHIGSCGCCLFGNELFWSAIGLGSCHIGFFFTWLFHPIPGGYG